MDNDFDFFYGSNNSTNPNSSNSYDSPKPAENESSSNEYHPLSYNEALSMRKRVREGAVEREYQHTIENKNVRQNNSANVNRSNSYQSNTYQSNNQSKRPAIPYETQLHRAMNTSRPSKAADGMPLFSGVIIFVLISLYIVLGQTLPYIMVYSYNSKHIKTYVEAEAVINETKQIETTGVDFSLPVRGTKPPKKHRQKITYTYEYKGKSYTIEQLLSLTKAEELGYTSDKIIGEKITAYVDPNDPKTSLIVLDSMLEFVDWLPLIFALIVLAIGIFVQYLFAKGKFTIVYDRGKKRVQLFG